jgi:DNA polymerase-3 subunit gamma/tau
MDDIVERLAQVLNAEDVAASPEAVTMIARAADGSMRDALSLADQVISISGSVTPDSVRDALGLVPEDEYVSILDIIADKRAGDVFPLVTRLADAGVDFGVFLSGLADALRAQLAVVLGGDAPGISPGLREAVAARSARFAAGDLLRMLNAITAIEPAFRKSGQQQLLVEMLLVRFALLERAVALEDLLQSLGGDAGGSTARSSGSPPSPEPSESARGGAVPERASPTPSRRAEGGDTNVRRSRAELDKWVAEPPAERITPEVLRRERVEAIRQRSPFMDAAIDALDLELLE